MIAHSRTKAQRCSFRQCETCHPVAVSLRPHSLAVDADWLSELSSKDCWEEGQTQEVALLLFFIPSTAVLFFSNQPQLLCSHSSDLEANVAGLPGLDSVRVAGLGRFERRNDEMSGSAGQNDPVVVPGDKLLLPSPNSVRTAPASLASARWPEFSSLVDKGEKLLGLATEARSKCGGVGVWRAQLAE